MCPKLKTFCTTGEKAAMIMADLTDTPMPKIGEMVTGKNGINILRMPSTSRAYPLKIEKKAEYYRKMFETAGLL